MAPTNNKQVILTAAYALADRAGASAVTLEAVAYEAGLSKSGVIYHFRSKEALLVGLVEFQVQRWERRLVEELPVPLQGSTLTQRLRAYVTVAADPTDGPTAADLGVIVDGVHRKPLMDIWLGFVDRWLTPHELTPRQQVVVAAADGIWTAQALGYAPASDASVDVLLELIGDDA